MGGALSDFDVFEAERLFVRERSDPYRPINHNRSGHESCQTDVAALTQRDTRFVVKRLEFANI